MSGLPAAAPGQLFVTRTEGFVGACIRAGTRSPVDHAGICVDIDPDGVVWIVEAEPGGARLVPLRYPHVRWSSFSLLPGEIETITAQARLFAAEKIPYFYADIAALSLDSFGIDIPPVWARLNRQDRLICSQLVAACYDRIGVELVPGKLPCQVTPGALLVAVDALGSPPLRRLHP